MKTIPLTETPLVSPNENIGEVLLKSLRTQNVDVEDGDIFVIAQTIVSKAEGNVVDLKSVEAGKQAREIADKIGEEERKVQVILDETENIVRLGKSLISETKHGFVCANAGVDSSNVSEDEVTILPDDPDASAERIRTELKKEFDREIAVIISDSWGRPFRLGAVGFAIGVSGMKSLIDLRGSEDAYGKEMKSTMIAPPDSLAAFASLEMGEGNEMVPAVIIRGCSYETDSGSIKKLLRSKENDLFR